VSTYGNALFYPDILLLLSVFYKLLIHKKNIEYKYKLFMTRLVILVISLIIIVFLLILVLLSIYIRRIHLEQFNRVLHNVNRRMIEKKKKKKENEDKYIPKVIWTYWHSKQIPSLVQKCVMSWRRYNPDFEIVVLNADTYKEYISNSQEIVPDKFDSITRFADFLRFQLLSEHGGIWMDATIICNASLSWVVENENENEREYVGYFMPNFTTDDRYPIIENWFMACTKGSVFMRDWNREVQRIRQFQDSDLYIEDVQKKGVNLQNLSSPSYLMCHAAAQVVLQNKLAQIRSYSIDVRSAVDKSGPFYYLSEEDWDSYRGLQNMRSRYETPLVKLRGAERATIEQYPSLEETIFK